jgi:branched-chain amino acid transport system ATP-binding protein
MLTVENILLGMHLHLNANLFDIIFRTKRAKQEEVNAYQTALELDYVRLSIERRACTSSIWRTKKA